MNVKNVYLCNIYMKDKCNSIFIKRAVVYWKKNGSFIDLETKIKYKAGSLIAEDGEYFVELMGKMKSIYNIMDITKKNQSKKKILRLVARNVSKEENEV